MKTFHADITIKFTAKTERYVEKYIKSISQKRNQEILDIQVQHSPLTTHAFRQQVRIDIVLIARSERAVEDYLYRLREPQRRDGHLFVSMSVRSKLRCVEVADDAKAITKKQNANQKNIGKSYIQKLIKQMKYQPMEVRFNNFPNGVVDCELTYSKSLLPPKFSLRDKKAIEPKDWFNKIDNVSLSYNGETIVLDTHLGTSSYKVEDFDISILDGILETLFFHPFHKMLPGLLGNRVLSYDRFGQVKVDDIILRRFDCKGVLRFAAYENGEPFEVIYDEAKN